jgi:cobyrinic acid a,c-diamide synthase
VTAVLGSPRLVIAGASGDSGKTLASLGLLLAASREGLCARAFKKGPDYIDAAWLGWASAHAARNLDTFLMGFERVAASFARHATPDGLNVIEGNRGLYDGVDARGTHSTAELAKALSAPVLLVVNGTKVTRTAAAWVLGCQKLDPAVRIAGVILNQVSTARHERIVREAIESVCGVPVLGVLPRIERKNLLPQRHLGLVTPEEHPSLDELKQELIAVAAHLDFAKILAIAREASAFSLPATTEAELPDGSGLTIGYLKDSAFTFYYADNLEALESTGAKLVPISALSAQALPEALDALYIGGGFPETHTAQLASNHTFLESLALAARRGLPVYAECGGLMLLARLIEWRGERHPMAGVLPIDIEVLPTPQGHGYTELAVDRPNPFFPAGLALRGHEFHYSRVVLDGPAPQTACQVARGSGSFEHRDGIVAGNVWASYTHLNALATPEWAAGVLNAARRFASERPVSQLTHCLGGH